MLNRLKQTRNFVIVLLLLGSLLLPQISMAQGSSASPPLSTADRLLAIVEEKGFLEQEVTYLRAGTEESQRTIALLEERIKSKDDIIALLKEMLAKEKEFDDRKDALHEAQLKAATPTFAENLQKYLVGGGVGAALLGLVILAL
jgi:hypothetical protein